MPLRYPADVVRGARARRGSRGAICLLALCCACSFDRSGSTGGAGGDGGPPDSGPAEPDAEVNISCTAGERLCFGHIIETCNDAGDGFVEEEAVACALSCEPNAGDPLCTAPSNIPGEDAATCGGSAPALAPTSGTVTISISGGVERITCGGDCGSGESEILRVAALDQGSDPDIAWFCLSRLSIPDGVTVTVDSQVTSSIAFLVAGDVSIAGSLVMDGHAASADAAGGAGPGGGAGAAPAGGGGGGGAGSGRCPGEGGGRAGNTGEAVGAGGSGAGYVGVGGDGGNGISVGGGGQGDGTPVTGPQGGRNTCDGDGTLVPLVGGGGGGSGGDGSCGVQDCGFPGGGGGGALQISARGLFEVSGALAASGGAGHGDATGNLSRGGGGGGGAGGAFLLEAPMLALSGSFAVIGGVGGLAGAGLGGDGGGSGTRVGQVNAANGSDADADGEGGAGGGGAAGLVRLNALIAPTCPGGITPGGSCTTGTLTVIPDPL